MFYGREEELRILKDNYSSDEFKMVVLYGRRRVGKSYLLQHFFESLDANIIAFQAIENSASLSISAFKDVILDVFPADYDVNLDSWKDCFAYINNHLTDKKTIICIDEINYIFKEDRTFASQLQNEIDNHLKNKNVLLIVCGSSISSIENEVLNANSPLYGRRNISIKLQEFNYLEAANFYNNYSYEDKIIAYSVFGGKGKYLAAINQKISIKENIIKEILTSGGTLADEIDLLLKDDFRDPTFYKELLYVISLGNATFNDISTKMHAESSKLAIYLNRLIKTKIIEKTEIVGFKKKKDYRYYIQDNFLSFYFRFVYKRKNILNILVSPSAYYERFIANDLLSYVGLKFEDICEQYLINKSLKGELSFIPLECGKYYGKHPNGETFDIDVLFKDEETAIIGECKYTNKKFDLRDMNELVTNASTINTKNTILYVFTKKGIDSCVNKHYPHLNVVTLDELYK